MSWTQYNRGKNWIWIQVIWFLGWRGWVTVVHHSCVLLFGHRASLHFLDFLLAVPGCGHITELCPAECEQHWYLCTAARLTHRNMCSARLLQSMPFLQRSHMLAVEPKGARHLIPESPYRPLLSPVNRIPTLIVLEPRNTCLYNKLEMGIFVI